MYRSIKSGKQSFTRGSWRVICDLRYNSISYHSKLSFTQAYVRFPSLLPTSFSCEGHIWFCIIVNFWQIQNWYKMHYATVGVTRRGFEDSARSLRLSATFRDSGLVISHETSPHMLSLWLVCLNYYIPAGQRYKSVLYNSLWYTTFLIWFLKKTNNNKNNLNIV